ncbi:MAG: hypothetical protein IPK76_05915 [Lewinellaceae bacterium]|nr:hypothetical protein [Lewinellaceae bacterium]
MFPEKPSPQEIGNKLEPVDSYSLTDIVLSAGYFDQAHFIHELQSAFGESPGTYFK